MNDLMRGFSMAFMFAALGFGIFDLVLRNERTELLKRVALVNILWLGAMMILSLRYFFAVPTSFLATTLILFALAWFKLPARSGQPS